MNKIGIYILENMIKVGIADEAGAFREYEVGTADITFPEAARKVRVFLEEQEAGQGHTVLFKSRKTVFLRIISLPARDHNEAKRMAAFKIKDLYPFRPDELVYDSMLLGGGDEGFSRVAVAAVERALLIDELSAFAKEGINIDAVHPSFYSLFLQIQAQRAVKDARVFIHREETMYDILAFVGDELFLSRWIPAAEKDSRALALEAERTLAVLGANGIQPKEIALSGAGYDTPDAASRLEARLGIPVTSDTRFTTTKGVMLCEPRQEAGIDLLPFEVKSREAVVRLKKTALYFVILVVVTFSLAANIVYLKLKEKNEYRQFLKTQIRLIEGETILLREKREQLKILDSYDSSARRALGTVSELFKMLPATVALNTLRMENPVSGKRILLVSGESSDNDSIYSLSSALEGSRYFKDVTVNYIKSSRKSPGKIEFEMKVGF